MKKLTATDLVKQIAQLDMQQIYTYVSGRAHFKIIEIEKPEGPVSFANVNQDGEQQKTRSISKQQLALMSLVCSNKPNHPLHIDRVFSAGGNTRSALEALLAHTPHFFMCHPERIDPYTGEMNKKLKHIMWCPDDKHLLGTINHKEYNHVITEVELGVDYGQINITPPDLRDDFDNIETKRVHTQMQIALIEIGNALNFRTWIAKNDRHIQVNDKHLGDLEGVITSLGEIDIFYRQKIKDAASLVDCIWFTEDGNRIPAVIEVEHSTGVTSGLTRMLKLRKTFPAISTNFTIVAPNNLRNKVVKEANEHIYRELDARFMPYSTVQELYGLIQRYSLADFVDYRFIYPFMESVINK